MLNVPQPAHPSNVIELEPMEAQPIVQVEIPPKANDNLFFTMALIFLCFLMCFNVAGALCLMPGLICATLVCACCLGVESMTTFVQEQL